MGSLGNPPSMVCSMTLVPARLISRKCFDKSQEIFGFQLAKTDGGGGGGEGSKGIRNPLTLASTFFLTATRLHRALFVCQ